MAKKTKKKKNKLKIKGKTHPKVDAKKIAEALGAEIITDPEEIAEYKKKFRRHP